MINLLKLKALDQASIELGNAITALRALPVEEKDIPFYHVNSPLYSVSQGIDKALSWIDAVKESIDI